MSEKRRDNKNRILRQGESQRKDGRYVYKYTDAFGKPQFVYAWKLVPTDRIPAGKRDDISLREKEKQIQKDIDDGINGAGKNITVSELYDLYIRYHRNVKRKTADGRAVLKERLQKDQLSTYPIERVKPSDAQEWVLRMKDNGLSYGTIDNAKRALKAAFKMAIQNDYIRKNPFDFRLDTIIENDTQPKEPLTPEQERSLLSFIQNDKCYQQYYDEFIILLRTGLRISEFCGLTAGDIDFENRSINVDHQLLYGSKGERGHFIDTPKTATGIRQIPMVKEVYEAFQRVLERKRPAKEITIDGYSHFLFITCNGQPRTSSRYRQIFQSVVKGYKKCNVGTLPKSVTPHILRHTFCTNMANAGMNPKALQYIMGHSSINMTLNYYAHTSFDSAKAEMDRIMNQE